MTKPLHELSIAEAGKFLRSRELSSQALTQHALARIAQLDPLLHAFVLVTAERAMEDATRADEELAAGVDKGPLHGIPYALKDIYDTAGIATTCNSKLLMDRIPSSDSTVEKKLKAGGAVLLGKLNTHEFAIGGPSFDLPFPPARNPWNPDHFTGGSSAGSGVAVGAGFMRVALGSDTGGSIRSPACHCGVVGLKPTYGLVSRRGVYPLSYSLDHCGPLTWSVEDAALVMNVIAGFDPLDPGSVKCPVSDFAAGMGRDIKGFKIAYARNFFARLKEVSAEAIAAVDAAVKELARQGAVVEEVELPDYELFKACGRLIMIAEAYAIHEGNLKARPLDYGRYTYQRVAPGATISAADLLQAFRLRRELTVALNQVFNSHDMLVTTTGHAPAARLDEFPLDWPPPAVASAMHTAPFNVTGNPALATPIGFSKNGLPFSMQVVGRAFDEVNVFRVADAYERAAGVSLQRPKFATDGEPILSTCHA